MLAKPSATPLAAEAVTQASHDRQSTRWTLG
jgi:hypothetical protein